MTDLFFQCHEFGFFGYENHFLCFIQIWMYRKKKSSQIQRRFYSNRSQTQYYDNMFIFLMKSL